MSLIVIKVISLTQIITGFKAMISLAYFISICFDSFIALNVIIKQKICLQIAIIGSAINLLIWTLIWLAFVVCMSEHSIYWCLTKCF